jgi:hypothetical protein
MARSLDSMTLNRSFDIHWIAPKNSKVRQVTWFFHKFKDRLEIKIFFLRQIFKYITFFLKQSFLFKGFSFLFNFYLSLSLQPYYKTL